MGSVGQESLVFIPLGAQGFEQTHSGDTLKSLVIQCCFRTRKFRINQSKRFLKLASQWNPHPAKWSSQAVLPALGKCLAYFFLLDRVQKS